MQPSRHKSGGTVDRKNLRQATIFQNSTLTFCAMIMAMEERPRHGRPRRRLRLHDRRSRSHCTRRPVPNRMRTGPWDHWHGWATMHTLLRLAHELWRPDGNAADKVRLLLGMRRTGGHHLRNHRLLLRRVLLLRGLLLLLHVDHLYPGLWRLRLLRSHHPIA